MAGVEGLGRERFAACSLIAGERATQRSCLFYSTAARYGQDGLDNPLVGFVLSSRSYWGRRTFR